MSGRAAGDRAWGRWWAVFLAGMAGLGAATPRAEAGACHAIERPVIAARFAWLDERTDGDEVEVGRMIERARAAVPGLVPAPCPGEATGALTRGVAIAPAAVMAAPGWAFEVGPWRPMLVPAEGTRPRSEGRRLERPPRGL